MRLAWSLVSPLVASGLLIVLARISPELAAKVSAWLGSGVGGAPAKDLDLTQLEYWAYQEAERFVRENPMQPTEGMSFSKPWEQEDGIWVDVGGGDQISGLWRVAVADGGGDPCGWLRRTLEMFRMAAMYGLSSDGEVMDVLPTDPDFSRETAGMIRQFEGAIARYCGTGGGSPVTAGLTCDRVRMVFAGRGRRLLGGEELLARWNLGTIRIAELIQFALAAFEERIAPVRALAMSETQRGILEMESAKGLEVLRSGIETWQDEAMSPQNDAGQLIVDSGAGAKARLQAYILSWVDRIVGKIEEALRAVVEVAPLGIVPSVSAVEKQAKESWGQDPEWQRRWTWFENGMRSAEAKLRSMLPAGVLEVIDFEKVFTDVVAELDLSKLHPGICECQIVNGAVIHIIKLYGQPGSRVLEAGDELALWSLMLTCMVPSDLEKPWWEWGEK